MASFDENGKYIKTNWKAGDKITATKLNKIEESIEAVNDNDISRHVEADARLDALEAKDVVHDKEFTNVRNLIADNKAAAELGDYEINSRMTFLENELNEGIEEVHNVAETVDGKINAAVTNVNDVASAVDGKIAQGKADMEAMVAEVEADLEGLHAKDEELSVQLEQIEKIIYLSPTGYNDTEMLETAINSLEYGGTVKLLQGEFVLDYIKLSKNVNIEGVGKSTILKINECTDNFITFKDGYTNMLTISNLTIDGNKQNNNCENAIYLNKDTLPSDLELYDCFITIENIFIKNVYGNGIYLGNNARETRVKGVIINGCGGDGLVCITSDSHFSDISILQNDGSGLKEHGTANRYNNIKCFFNKNYGFHIKSSHTTFSQCEAQENYLNGWCFDNSMLIIGNGIISSTNSLSDINNLSGVKIINCDRINIDVLVDNFRTVDGLNPQKIGVELDTTTRNCFINITGHRHNENYVLNNSTKNNKIIVNTKDVNDHIVKEFSSVTIDTINPNSSKTIVLDFDGATDRDIFLAQPLHGLAHSIIWTCVLAEENKIALKIYNTTSSTLTNVTRDWKVIKFNL